MNLQCILSHILTSTCIGSFDRLPMISFTYTSRKNAWKKKKTSTGIAHLHLHASFIIIFTITLSENTVWPWEYISASRQCSLQTNLQNLSQCVNIYALPRAGYSLHMSHYVKG